MRLELSITLVSYVLRDIDIDNKTAYSTNVINSSTDVFQWFLCDGSNEAPEIPYKALFNKVSKLKCYSCQIPAVAFTSTLIHQSPLLT